MVPIAFLLRLLGFGRRADGPAPEPEEIAPPPPVEEAPPAPTGIACPSCAVLIDPPPTRTRLCPSCRRRIVVRSVEGRAVYLTEEAVPIFEGERRREEDEQRWTDERGRWLHLARLVGAPVERRRHLAGLPISATVVRDARALYLSSAEKDVRAARREKRWGDVARIRRAQAAALHEEAGGGPPAPEIVALHREGLAATLRSLARVSREAELAGSTCCRACRAESEQVFRIADELRTPRLPHEGCPRGLCPCDWWSVTKAPARPRRKRAAGPAPGRAAGPGA